MTFRSAGSAKPIQGFWSFTFALVKAGAGHRFVAQHSSVPNRLQQFVVDQTVGSDLLEVVLPPVATLRRRHPSARSAAGVAREARLPPFDPTEPGRRLIAGLPMNCATFTLAGLP